MLCTDIRILFIYLSHSLAPGCRWEVPALRNPSSSIWPGTENGADPAGAAQRSLVMRKSQKRRKPGIWAPLSVPGGSPEPCPQRWSACLWTAPPPDGWASCPERRNTQKPRSYGVAHHGLWSARVEDVSRSKFGFGRCFLDLNQSQCPLPCCWKSCCCRVRPKMEPADVPCPERPLRCWTPLLWQAAEAVKTLPL